MNTLTVHSKTDKKGHLKIDIPTEIIQSDVEVLLVIEKIQEYNKNIKSLDELYGSMPDFPERFSQGNFDLREDL